MRFCEQVPVLHMNKIVCWEVVVEECQIFGHDDFLSIGEAVEGAVGNGRQYSIMCCFCGV